MWQLNERVLVKFHIAGSLATIACCVVIFTVCLAPALYPSIYQMLRDDRIALVIPYLLFVALGESVFSIWYFLFRK